MSQISTRNAPSCLNCVGHLSYAHGPPQAAKIDVNVSRASNSICYGKAFVPSRVISTRSLTIQEG